MTKWCITGHATGFHKRGKREHCERIVKRYMEDEENFERPDVNSFSKDTARLLEGVKASVTTHPVLSFRSEEASIKCGRWADQTIHKRHATTRCIEEWFNIAIGNAQNGRTRISSGSRNASTTIP